MADNDFTAEMMKLLRSCSVGLKDDSERQEKVDKINDLVKDSIPMQHGYANTFIGNGAEDNMKSFENYGLDNSTLNYPLWTSLYNDSWVFRRAIDKPAQDEVNCGFILKQSASTDEPIDFAPIYKAFDKYKFDMIQLLQWGALYGGAIGVMMFDGISDEEMQKPISAEKVRGRKMRLYVTDRWYGVAPSTESVTNMRDMDFGTPMSYSVTFADGRYLSNIHHSYVLRYEHRTAPKLIKCGMLQGWGYAEGCHILNELTRDDQLKSAITSLVNKANIEIIKMSGMRGVFMGADQGNEEQLTKRLEMVNWGRNYNSLTFLDKDDDYQNYQVSVAGLADLLSQNLWLVSSALEMQGILFGDLRGGLSQENDDMERYAVTIRNRCDSYYRPVLQKLLTVLYLIYGIEGSVDFEFKSLTASKDHSAKMSSINSYSSTLNQLVQNGVISKYQAAVSIKEFINHDNIDIQITDEMLDKLKYEEQRDILATYKGRNDDGNSSMRGGIGRMSREVPDMGEEDEGEEPPMRSARGGGGISEPDTGEEFGGEEEFGGFDEGGEEPSGEAPEGGDFRSELGLE